MRDKIIIVDDEREIADLIGLYLENDGYEAVKLASGVEALGYMERCEPALAILDIMLPDIDGFSLLKKNSGKLCLSRHNAHRPSGGHRQDTRPYHGRRRLYHKAL